MSQTNPAPNAVGPPPRRRSFSISHARWRDLPTIASLQRRAFPARLAYGLGTLVILKALPTVRFFVARAEAGGEILGCGIGDRHDGESRVINLAVDPAARRQGIGSALLLELESALPLGDMLLMVEAGNDPAIALYQRLGYREVGRAQHYYGPGRTGIWMRKTRQAASTPRSRLWV